MRIPIENPTIKNGKILNITQGWGENPQMYQLNFGIPGHNGLDLCYLSPEGSAKASYGKPVLSAIDGVVRWITWDGEHATKGNGIYICNDEFETIYWHLSKICVQGGQEVKAGDKIGEMGNSGFCFPMSTPERPWDGTHLHFGVRPLKNGKIAYPDNKFEGYVDPLPYLTMLNLYGNEQTKEQYIKGTDGFLHRIANTLTLNDLHDAGIINKEGVVWLDQATFSTYRIGNVWLAYNDQ